MNRRLFIGSGLLAAPLFRNGPASAETPEAEPTFRQVHVASMWVDEREEPLIWYSIRITALTSERGMNPYYWMTDPNAVALENFDAEVDRPIAAVEYPLPDMGDKVRYDATYRIQQRSRIGPYIVSVKDNVIMQQASIAYRSLTSGVGGLNGPADAAILGCITRLTELDGPLDVTQVDSLMPTAEELDEAGLTIRTRNEYVEM